MAKNYVRVHQYLGNVPVQVGKLIHLYLIQSYLSELNKANNLPT